MKPVFYLLNIFIFILTAQLIGCEVTSEKISRWKQSENGAPKLRAAVRDTSQKLSIRVEAAEALGDLGLFSPLAEDIKSLEEADRKQVMAEIAQQLLVRMKGSNPKASTKIQIQAKDILFSLRDMADENLHQSIDDSLVSWILDDWENRNTGEHSSEKIITAIGAASGPLLAAKLDGNPNVVVPLATILRQVGDQESRDAGAAKLIEIAQQQNSVKMQTLHALGKLGSPKAVGYLAAIAKNGEFQQRVWALRALALEPNPTIIPLMKQIASDTSLKDDRALLRDEAFTVLEKIEVPHSLTVLLTFLNDKEDKVRYRAIEAIITGFKTAGLAKLLEGLPPKVVYKKQDVIDFIENVIIEAQLGPGALQPLRSALKSQSWIAKLISVRTLRLMGTKEQDMPVLEKMATDSTKLPGWDGGATLGIEAKAAAEAIKNRK